MKRFGGVSGPLFASTKLMVVTSALALLAGVLRVVRLDIPRGRIFDEIYYACDSQNLLRYGVEAGTEGGNADCIPNGEAGFIVHPPLGKWAIALGMRVFGVNEFGWRIAAAVAEAARGVSRELGARRWPAPPLG